MQFFCLGRRGTRPSGRFARLVGQGPCASTSCRTGASGASCYPFNGPMYLSRKVGDYLTVMGRLSLWLLNSGAYMHSMDAMPV